MKLVIYVDIKIISLVLKITIEPCELLLDQFSRSAVVSILGWTFPFHFMGCVISVMMWPYRQTHILVVAPLLPFHAFLDSSFHWGPILPSKFNRASWCTSWFLMGFCLQCNDYQTWAIIPASSPYFSSRSTKERDLFRMDKAPYFI